ncbi:MAG: response regulator transcription factor [Candidatus Krumholzibacteriota bacterium]|nr:response regulator transcription factor [Candidatus Krumholzibacteriota bacterium]
MKIKALIVDDEKLARSEMRFLLGDYGEIEVIGEASGGGDAISIIRKNQPDIVFLDIQMPEVDGFQVVRTLMEEKKLPLVIFTTAYDQYAIKAFEINAIDYLLKPIEKERLSGAIERAKAILPRREEYLDRIRKLTENIKGGTRFLPRLVIKKDDGMMGLVEVEKIAMLHNEGGKVTAYTDDGRYESNYSDIDEIEVQIDPKVFTRLGAEYLVNPGKIVQIIPWSGGNYIMTIDDSEKTEVRLQRSQAQLLKNKIEGIF